MTDIIGEVWTLAQANLDVLLIAGMVVIVQTAKRALPLVPSKAWMLVMVGIGFLLAWLKIPVVMGHVKDYISEGIKYAAGAELLYQAWRAASEVVASKIGHVPKGKG